MFVFFPPPPSSTDPLARTHRPAARLPQQALHLAGRLPQHAHVYELPRSHQACHVRCVCCFFLFFLCFLPLASSCMRLLTVTLTQVHVGNPGRRRRAAVCADGRRRPRPSVRELHSQYAELRRVRALSKPCSSCLLAVRSRTGAVWSEVVARISPQRMNASVSGPEMYAALFFPLFSLFTQDRPFFVLSLRRRFAHITRRCMQVRLRAANRRQTH